MECLLTRRPTTTRPSKMLWRLAFAKYEPKATACIGHTYQPQPLLPKKQCHGHGICILSYDQPHHGT